MRRVSSSLLLALALLPTRRTAPQAKAAKEKAKAKASAKRQANKGNGGAVKGVMYMSRSTCLVCSEQPARGHRWCVEHKRAEAATKYQAQKSNQLQQYDQVMKDDAKAAEAVRDYVKSTPAGQRWTRKPLIDWVSWGQKYGVRLAVSEKDTSEPMTEAKFWRWAVDVEGQTESAAAAWWREIYESDADRDHNGRAGALRLWVPVSQVRERTKTRYIDASVESHSCQMKNVSPEELASLKNFTLDQDMSYGDDFMKQAASSSSPAKAAKLAPLAVADAEGKDVAGAPSATPVKVEPPCEEDARGLAAGVAQVAHEVHSGLNRVAPRYDRLFGNGNSHNDQPQGPCRRWHRQVLHGIPQELGVPIQSGFSLVGFWGVHVCQLYRPGLSLSMQDVLLSSSCCLSSLILLLDMCVSLLLVLFPGRCP